MNDNNASDKAPAEESGEAGGEGSEQQTDARRNGSRSARARRQASQANVARERAEFFARGGGMESEPIPVAQRGGTQDRARGRARDDGDEEEWPGPFATARRLLKARAEKSSSGEAEDSDEELPVEPDEASFLPPSPWAPREGSFSAPVAADSSRGALSWRAAPPPPGEDAVPSLESLCLRVLVQYIGHVETLGPVPSGLRRRLARALCKTGTVNEATLRLLTERPATELCLADCSSLSETKLIHGVVGDRVEHAIPLEHGETAMRRQSGDAVENETETTDAGRPWHAIRFGHCGRCVTDRVARAIAPAVTPFLHTLHLGGAYQLTDLGLLTLLAGVPLREASHLRDMQHANQTLRWLAVSAASLVRGGFLQWLPDVAPALQGLALDALAGVDGPALMGKRTLLESNPEEALRKRATDIRTDVSNYHDDPVVAKEEEEEERRAGSSDEETKEQEHEKKGEEKRKSAKEGIRVRRKLASSADEQPGVTDDVPRSTTQGFVRASHLVTSKKGTPTQKGQRSTDHGDVQPPLKRPRGPAKSMGGVLGLPHLRHLHLQRLPAVSSRSVAEILRQIGGQLESLALLDCSAVDDDVLRALSATIPAGAHATVGQGFRLESLTLSSLPNVTATGLRALAVSPSLDPEVDSDAFWDPDQPFLRRWPNLRHLRLEWLPGVDRHPHAEGALVRWILSLGRGDSWLGASPSALPSTAPWHDDRSAAAAGHSAGVDANAARFVQRREWVRRETDRRARSLPGLGDAVARAEDLSLEAREDAEDEESTTTMTTKKGARLRTVSLKALQCVTDRTLMALALSSGPRLRTVDLSWCRRVSDGGVGYLVDRAPSLVELRVWGASQLTEEFFHGHRKQPWSDDVQRGAVDPLLVVGRPGARLPHGGEV